MLPTLCPPGCTAWHGLGCKVTTNHACFPQSKHPLHLPPSCRFLAPLQPVDVWVELQVPRGTGQGLAQVVAQLTSVDGRVAAKASRAVMLRTDCWSFRCGRGGPLLRWWRPVVGTPVRHLC